MTEQAKGVRANPSKGSRTNDVGEEVGAATASADRLVDDIDMLLDEIDEVLESNAEEFVRNYVQKGGQ